MYGIDWQGPVPTSEATVEIPEYECPLQPHDMHTLTTVIDPLQSCDDYGVELYIATRVFVRNIA